MKELHITDADHCVSIDTAALGGTAGLWVSDKDQRSVGLVAQKNGTGPYLCIYAAHPAGGSLPLAITYDGIQLPRATHDDPYRFIAWDDLWAVIDAHKKDSPCSL